MTVEMLQNATNLVAAADLNKIKESNTILKSRAVLETVGGIEVLASELSKRGFKDTKELFAKLDELTLSKEVELTKE